MGFQKDFARADASLISMAQSALVSVEEFQKMAAKVVAMQADINRIEKMVKDQYVIEEMEP